MIQEFQESDMKDALIWYRNHTRHVDDLVRSCKIDGYPPVGSDQLRPEIWKATHWKWFLRYRNIRINTNSRFLIIISRIFRYISGKGI